MKKYRIHYDRTRLTLGELLTSDDITIKRNAMSILKMLSGCEHKYEAGRCIYCMRPHDPRNTDRDGYILCDICNTPEDPDGKCGCINSDSLE